MYITDGFCHHYLRINPIRIKNSNTESIVSPTTTKDDTDSEYITCQWKALKAVYATTAQEVLSYIQGTQNLKDIMRHANILKDLAQTKAFLEGSSTTFTNN